MNMKVKVSVKVATNLKSEAGDIVELMAKEADSVQAFKTKIMESQMIAFSKQDLTLEGNILPEAQSLGECGIHEGTLVELAVRTSEVDLVQSLTDLLRSQDLSLEELALLYCYKQGVSINQVLQSIGIHERFSTFMSRHAQFSCKGGRVSLTQRPPWHRPAPGLVAPATTVAAKFATSQGNSWTKVGRASSFVQHQGVSNSAQCDGVVTEPDNDAYLELHTKISGRAFSSKATQALNEIGTIVSENLFFNIDHVVRGGSVGRGTVIGGSTDAELVFLLRDMPVAGQLSWLPSLHKAVVGVLKEHVGSSHGIEDVHATSECVKLIVRGVVAVDLKFVPVVESYGQILKYLSQQGSEGRQRLAASLTKERTHFISKQPGQVKVTMRLLKWWRDQQQWSSNATRPSDDIIELLTVYSASQCKPHDQQTAVSNVLGLMARFDELCVTWSNFYKKNEIWEPLMNHRPLVMDPVNPYFNVADPQLFHSRELMMLAGQTHFFW